MRANYWLMKSEPDEFSIDDLVAAPKQTTAWFGVRNYTARNFMRDDMRVGDGVLFYHSSCPEPGIAGLAKVASTAYPDASQFDPKSPYFDPKSKPDEPRWVLVDVKLDRKTRLMPLSEMRSCAALASMLTLRRGNRLSITPVSEAEWKFILKRLDG
jgi:predicted RNA-binding protein with PUA-like domain